MRAPLVLAFTFAAALALALAAPRAADACSASCNTPAFFVPGDGATVPANLPGIFWRPRYDADPQAPSPSNVTLATSAAPGTPLVFTATRLANGHDYLLVPEAPLVAGTSYILTDSTACATGTGAPNPSVTFTAAAAAPLPTTLGALAVTELPAASDTIASGNGACSMDAVLASTAVAIDYAQAADAAPWRHVLHFETLVDGTAWGGSHSILAQHPPGASWEGRGVDRIYTVCSTDDPFGTPLVQASPGVHQVELRASLPGTAVALATGAASIDLDCAASADGDAGLDGEPGEAGGCCSSSTHPGAAAGLALLVALALTRPARRARRRRATAP